MQRRRTERKVGGLCKIRKRGCSSSTSSSSLLVKNYRVKRAILVGKRVGSTTPVPTWKMSLRSPSLLRHTHPASDKYKEPHTSARSLAASLWEINGSHPHPHDGEIDDEQMPRKTKQTQLDHCLSPLSKNKMAGHRRRSSGVSQKLELTEYIGGGLDSHSPTIAASLEGGATVKTRLREVHSSLAASKEIVKVLFRLWSQEEQSSSRLTLVSALRLEIDRARHQLQDLIQDRRSTETESAARKSREEDRAAAMGRDVENERKLRRQSERLNKRLGKELAETRAQLEESERAREALERKIGDDRDALREEVEMLQIADVLREERVQMKLSEARHDFEEKNSELERLRGELHAHLGAGQFSEGEESADSELLELNMDTLGFELAESRRNSVEEVFKGRRSLSERIQWENICLQRKDGEGNDQRLIKGGSRPDSPLGKGSKRVSVSLGDHLLDGGGGKIVQTKAK